VRWKIRVTKKTNVPANLIFVAIQNNNILTSSILIIMQIEKVWKIDEKR